jgi:hypothetical protein
MDMKITGTSIGSRAGRMLLLAALVLLQSCWITDHTERDPDEVTTDDIQHPASGYEKVDAGDLPSMVFDAPHFDMGKIIQGDKVDHRYTFRNEGGSALVLTDVRSSCGCTVSKDWPKHPIAPGEGGQIEITYDSEGRSGRQDRTITVVANTTPPSTVLTLSGEVVGPSNITPVE